MFLLFATYTPTGLLAQTNTISGSLINAPGNSSQTIPSRDVVMDFFGSAPATSYSDATNSSNDYSISYPGGGPIFAHDNARVYVDLSTANNPLHPKNWT